ncbi:hypothetical protein P153DRAFT_390402 [Dothidotthia symphoricarpi CBS 119687]|uniref:Uncharacterized protein n=1 Tax=Dothidotthia symphoricarpi CBS 119687 TaxID=1392245 RepID=A0A6A5ZZB6_9PLEO|nr:uncharacterized protein P153DRAFT_390402 [Dothidotthia symphoricarpi CBS 119687]KAF2124365.1 hypothetical protein P153DRAFT_390402 [Dothidotthia symphoricarpi CBS 119687]
MAELQMTGNLAAVRAEAQTTGTSASITSIERPLLRDTATANQSTLPILDLAKSNSLSGAPDGYVTPFLNRPAEIRNAIYETLFQYDDPIVLMGRHPWASPRLACPIPGVNFLSSCHQVWSEAAAMLYSRNTFLVCFPMANCEHTPYLHRIEKWLYKIGTHEALLRRLSIDLGPPCPARLPRRLDVAPLGNWIWSRTNSKLQILFVETDRTDHDPSSRHLHPSSTVQNYGVDVLNSMLACLERERLTTIGLYLRPSKVLESVILSNDGNRVTFLLSTDTHKPSRDPARIVLEVSNTGGLQRVYSKRQPIRLAELMYRYPRIEKRFSTLVGGAGHQLKYNLNKNTLSESLPETFAINKEIRELALDYFKREIIVEMSTQEPRATFGDFHALHGWIENIRPFSQVDGIQQVFDAPTIILLYDLAGRVNLNSVRYQATNLVRKASLLLDTSTTICVQLTCPEDSVIKQELGVTSLYELQRRCLLVLEALLDQHPTRRSLPCPDIWVDYRGLPCEIEFRLENPIVLEGEADCGGLILDTEACIQRLTEAYGGIDEETGTLLGTTLALADVLW